MFEEMYKRLVQMKGENAVAVRKEVPLISFSDKVGKRNLNVTMIFTKTDDIQAITRYPIKITPDLNVYTAMNYLNATYAGFCTYAVSNELRIFTVLNNSTVEDVMKKISVEMNMMIRLLEDIGYEN